MSGQGKVVFALDMYCLSSARRMIAEGFARTGLRYAMNYFYVWARGRPLTKVYRDYRA
jgi:hypothetical protein